MCFQTNHHSANAAAHAAGAARRPGGMASFGGAAAEKRKFKLVCFTLNCLFLFDIPVFVGVVFFLRLVEECAAQK